MKKEVSIVLSRESTKSRKLAQEWYGLTNEQMKECDVHHNPPRHQGGRNIPEHLFVYHNTLHSAVHGDDFTKWAREGGKKGAKKGGQALYERGEGLHSFTSEQHAENGRKGGTAAAKKLAKSVVCIETGNTYASTCEAERETGISRVCVSNCCLGKQNTAGKLHWKFVEVNL